MWGTLNPCYADVGHPRGRLPHVVPPIEWEVMKLVINGEEKSFADDLSLSALVEKLGMKPDRVAVELNRDIVPRERWASTALQEGDRLEIVHFVGGGNP